MMLAGERYGLCAKATYGGRDMDPALNSIQGGLGIYSGSHLMSYCLIDYPAFYHEILKSKTIFYTSPYI